VADAGQLTVGVAVWWFIPHEWAPLRWPLLLVVLAFTAIFPLRIFHGVLQGLQDLFYLGAAQLAGWTAGTIITIVGVMAGLGLYSLALGWVAGQALPAVLAWRRLRAVPGAVPERPPSARASRHWRAVRPRRMDQRVAGRPGAAQRNRPGGDWHAARA
jgi:hypothetical protein